MGQVVGPAEMVREFHEAFGLPAADTPRQAGTKLGGQRHRMLASEVRELLIAVCEGKLAHIAQELADCVYVLYGTALTYGIDLDAVIAEVHAANMTKLDDFDHAILIDGKVQKGPNYRPPNVAEVLARQQARAPEEGRGFGPEHRLTVLSGEFVDVGGELTRYELAHPADCNGLAYGERCSLDAPGDDRIGWPSAPGEYTICSWSSKDWTDSGYEYDAGVQWEPVNSETEAVR